MNAATPWIRTAAWSSAAILLLALGACQKKPDTAPAPVAAAPATPAAASPPVQATGEGESEHGEGPDVGRRMREQHAPDARAPSDGQPNGHR